MKKLFLSMSVAAAVTAGAAPMTAYAKDMTALSVNCDSSLLQEISCGQYFVITNQEEGTEKLKELLSQCGVDLDELLESICSGKSDVDVIIPDIGTTFPDTDVTVPDIDVTVPDTDTTAPDTGASVPDTGVTTPDEADSDKNVPDSSPEDAADSSEAVHPYVLRIVELVNEERAKAGLNPVTLDTGVSSAAQVRAQEIVSSFSHTRPNGSSFSTALKEQGVSYRSAGENIAYGQRTPELVMEGWMNSSGHRANILNQSFTHIGVGYHQENGVNYWTQIFIQ